jgi:class 3 adenylate cyclase
MFCDLVDSTGIAAKLDAEEWRDLVGAYLDAASAAVMEMGGKVAKKLGDRLMALFGYAMAQEAHNFRRAFGLAAFTLMAGCKVCTPAGWPYELCGLTAAANFLKNSSAIFFAAPLMSRWPSCASLPPMWARRCS